MKRIKKHLHSAVISHEGNNYTPHVLRHKSLAAIAAFVVIAKIGVLLLVALMPGIVYPSSITSQTITNLTNQQRSGSGLSQLALNSKLNQAAQAKAQDMLSQQYFSHYSPSDLSPWHWFQTSGYEYAYAGENLAMDFVTAESVVSAWMASESHKKNILNGQFTEIGIGVLEGDFNGAKTILVVQMFGAPVPVTTVAEATTVEEVAEEKPVSEPVTEEIIEEKSLPEIEPEKTVVIPSPVEEDTYDVTVAIKEEPKEELKEEPIKVAVKQGDNLTELTKSGDTYIGNVKEDKDTPSQNITVLMEDENKNVVSATIVNTDYFKTSIVTPDKYWSSERLIQLIFYSRNFFITLLIFLSLVLILNTLIRIRVKRQPSVLYSLLLIYMIGVIIII